MYLKTALEIIVAFFCVIGIYAVWRMVTQKLFGDKNIVIAVEIICKKDAEASEALIREALESFLALRSQKIVVITTPELQSNTALNAAIKRYGARLYITDI